MAMKTFDWPWTKELYEMQWQYPYIADIAESPETNRLDEPMQPESQQREQQPTTPTPQPQATATAPTSPPVNPGYMGMPPLRMRNIIAPIAIIVGAIVLYKLLLK